MAFTLVRSGAVAEHDTNSQSIRRRFLSNHETSRDETLIYVHHLKILHDLVGEAITAVPDPIGDSAFMALSFTHKQHLNSEAVCLLVDAELDRDAGLIARSMFEGFALLYYTVNRDAEGLPRRWRAFALIEDYRTMRELEELGKQTDPEFKSRLHKQLDAEGTVFLKGNAQECLAKGDDPYKKLWLDVKMLELLKGIDSEHLYKATVEPLNKWMHWSVAGLASAWQENDKSLIFRRSDPEVGRTSAAAAYTSLYHCAILADDILKLGYRSRLDAAKREYQAAI